MFGWRVLVEHMSDYIRTQERTDMTGARRPKGFEMATMYAHPEVDLYRDVRPAAPRRVRRFDDVDRGPRPARPEVVGPRYRRTGVAVSRAPHRRTPARRITPLTVVGLAVSAALITVWLGVVAQFGEGVRASEQVPERLAVVQVQSGETLAHVAARVAPEAPVHSVVDRIRELNELESAGVNAGQTLIAPVG
jgi:hypothetical protein